MYLDLLIDSIQKGQIQVDDISNHDLRVKAKTRLSALPKDPGHVTLKEIANRLKTTPQAATVRLRPYTHLRIGRIGKGNQAVLFKKEILSLI